MSGMDRPTDNTVRMVADNEYWPTTKETIAMARELLAHRRASQAASGGCGYPCGYDCNGACFQAAPAPSDELAQIDAMLMEGQGDDDGDQVLPGFEPGWSVAAKVEACLHLLEKRRDLIAATAPSDHLVSVGKASGMVEARVSLAARQIRQTLRDYGHRCAETSLPDLIAADVDAALRKQDELHAPAPSDGLREAAATILAVLEDPDSLAYEHHPDWQAIYTSMTEDHNQSMEICGIHDWPSLLTTAMEIMAEPRAALSAPAQEGGE